MEERPIAEARADLSGLASMVQFGRRIVFLTRRGKPLATVVPTELGDEADLAGGADAAIKVLRHARGCDDE